MADASLLLLLDQVRGKTLALLRSIKAEESLWVPTGLNNSVVWHAGHCYFVLESLTMRALGRKPKIPSAWERLFSWDSHPEIITAECWPHLTMIIAELESQQDRVSQLVSVLSDRQLDQPLVFAPEQTVRYAIIHALHDEACHCGEIHLLGKMRAVARGQAEA
jgi:hypothetical protein